MARVAFLMQLKAGNEEAYQQKHDEIWPEMVETLHSFGVRNYSIYRHGLTLFAYLECDDPTVLDRQRDSPVVQRWWQMMQPLMVYNNNGTPWSEPIDEVFHME